MSCVVELRTWAAYSNGQNAASGCFTILLRKWASVLAGAATIVAVFYRLLLWAAFWVNFQPFGVTVAVFYHILSNSGGVL